MRPCRHDSLPDAMSQPVGPPVNRRAESPASICGRLGTYLWRFVSASGSRYRAGGSAPRAEWPGIPHDRAQ
jgi:hypothetical protein